ncbi:MAG: PAS domain-containing protein [Patescibacteria group bacterium]
MITPFLILCVQTLLLWFFVGILYRTRNRITLIPFYAYIGMLTILTHNLTDLGFSIVVNQWFFLIGSFSFFTTLMFAILFLYLFEGPRAGRFGLFTVLFTSFFYIGIVYLLNLQVDVTHWVQFDLTRGVYYFWSILAIVLDILFLAFVWELLSKVKSLPLPVRVFIIIFGVFALDALVFTTGAFWNSDLYASMLKSNLITRLVLSFIGAPLIAYLLKSGGFSEEKREKPKNFWEIVNFRSDLETKIVTLEEMIKKYKDLEEKLRETEETYRLAVNGTGAGIWDWNVLTNHVFWSPRVCALLGYESGELKENLDAFKAILHPEDMEKTFAIVNQCFQDGKPFETEYRLKTKGGDYKWFLATGVTKYDETKKPIRMVGSIIDITKRKQNDLVITEKVNELTRLNQLMVGRELKMVALKEEINKLKESK